MQAISASNTQHTPSSANLSAASTARREAADARAAKVEQETASVEKIANKAPPVPTQQAPSDAVSASSTVGKGYVNSQGQAVGTRIDTTA